MKNKDFNIQTSCLITNIYVIVPVFNSCNYLVDCIESVLIEKKLNIKLILIDDGSTDNSGEVCDYYSKLDNRVVAIHQKNQGQIIARETGLRYVLTQYGNNKKDIIMFLDSDDSFKNITLSEVNRIMNDSSIDMMIFGMDRVCEGKIIQAYDTNGRINGVIDSKRELYRIVFNDWTYNPVCGKALRISLLDNLNFEEFKDIRYGEDLIQSIEYYKKSSRVYFYNKSLYNYTINPNSMTQTINKRSYSVDFTVRQFVMNFLIKEDVFDELDWIEYRTFCMWLIADMLRTICLLDIDLGKKIKLIEEMRSSEYYCLYLQDKRHNTLNDWWSLLSTLLFTKKHNVTIAIIGTLYKKLRYVKNKVKEVLK